MIVSLEIVEALALVSGDDVADILFGMDIADPCRRHVVQNLIADSMNQMGFPESDAAEEIKRIVGNAGIVGDLYCSRPGKLVGLAGDETVERHVGIDPALFPNRCFCHLQFVFSFRLETSGCLYRRFSRRGWSLCGRCRAGTGIQDELDFYGSVQELGCQCGDSVGILGFDPVQLETIGSCYTQDIAVVFYRNERFDPCTVLLGCLVQFQLRQTVLPEVFHIAINKTLPITGCRQ